jgi:Domain of unknown function DUF11/HYR domain/FG-GAP-like repeat/FG-GAP repeat
MPSHSVRSGSFSSQPSRLFIRAALVVALAAAGILPITSGRMSRALQPSVRASALGGGSRINLRPATDLPSSYGGSANLVRILEQNSAEPLALAAGDFDEDGVPDLAAAYVSGGSGILSLHRGNPDAIYPNSPDAQRRRAQNQFTSEPFFPNATLSSTPESPEFLGAADFDGDGHLDLISAAGGSDRFYVMAGNGRGEFAPARLIGTGGSITVMTTATSMPSGQSSVMVGVDRADGPALLIFGSSDVSPRALSLPSAATAIAQGDFDGDGFADLAIAAGARLVLAHGDMGQLAGGRVDERRVGYKIVDLAAGDFGSGRRADLALLASDGAVHILSSTQSLASSGKTGGMWSGESLALGSWPGARRLVGARMSGSNTDDLVVIEGSNARLQILVNDALGQAGSADGASIISHSAASVDLGGDPAAVLGMRLGSDAAAGLVVLRSGTSAPATLVPAVATTFTVINENDSGAGSLRAAIVSANGNIGADTIDFAIVTGAPFTIPLASPLPAITEAVTIDATTQPGFAGTPIVEVNGAAAGAGDGLSIQTDDVVVRGLVINRFDGNGISITGNTNHVEGNFIGVDLTGLLSLANSGDGVAISGASSGNVVGGTVAAARNVISGNQNGVSLTSASTTGNTVAGNFIGTDALGANVVGNTLDGLALSTATSNIIGGLSAGSRNVISGNRNGVAISSIASAANGVQGNFIGTAADGTTALGNNQNGVSIASSGNSIGGAGATAGNTIAFNGKSGVSVASGVNNPIETNSIFSNAILGIDLAANGVPEPNDALDADVGANGLQNFPVLTNADSLGGSITIDGSLDSKASTTYRVEFFANQSCSPMGFGEGKTFLGTAPVTTDAAGHIDFSEVFAVAVTPGQVVTATATDPLGSTSEFSQCLPVGGIAGGTSADLSVTIVMTPSPALTGTGVVKLILVSNAGPDAADNVTLTDTLASSLVFASCAATGGGVCGGSGNTRTVTFSSIPSGSSAAITINANVACTAAAGTVIGNTVAVFSATTPDPNLVNNLATATTTASNTPPTITCPANLSVPNDLGLCSAVVNFPVIPVTDNCPGVVVSCTPPSGSAFPIGQTGVNCTATDTGGASVSCSFSVTVTDTQPVAIVCPSNVVVTALPGQCTPAVTYSPPSVIDNCPNATSSCVPPSGSAFPVGVTTVGCTATDAAGHTATCSFTVTVIGTPQATVTLEGDGNSLTFGPKKATRKLKKEKKRASRQITIQNTGCAPLVVSLKSIVRTGKDVDRGTIVDTNDLALYTLKLINNDNTETELGLLQDVSIAPGVTRRFKLLFNPVIPPLANSNEDLAATEVLPPVVNSLLTLNQNAGAPIDIPLVGRVTTALNLLNPNNSRKPAFVTFTKSGDEFNIQYSIYDPNLDVDHATYQFLDGAGNPVQSSFTVDLRAAIQSRNLVTGQSFTIVQTATGARDHREVTNVRVTVFDPEASVSLVSSGVVPLSAAVATQSLGTGLRTLLLAPTFSIPSSSGASPLPPLSEIPIANDPRSAIGKER